MRKLLTFLAVMLVPLALQAQTKTYPMGEVLEDTALNAGASSLTFTIGPNLGTSKQRLIDFSLVTFDVTYTHSNNGAITLTCTGTGDSSQSTGDGSLTTCTTASGTCTLNFGGVVTTPSLSADKQYVFPLRITGIQVLTCVASHGGTPDASDKIKIVATLSNGG